MERIGRSKRSRVFMLSMMLSLALVVSAMPAAAAGPGQNQAFLYELSENATLTNYAGHLLLPDPTGTSPTGLIDAVTGSTSFVDVVPAKRNAQSALQGYDGAVVLVTHDRRFIDRFGATRTIRL